MNLGGQRVKGPRLRQASAEHADSGDDVAVDDATDRGCAVTLAGRSDSGCHQSSG